jgi:hypothetical protein
MDAATAAVLSLFAPSASAAAVAYGFARLLLAVESFIVLSRAIFWFPKKVNMSEYVSIGE